jgi:predicted aldo/keto reductase-like oxidoreductase
MSCCPGKHLGSSEQSARLGRREFLQRAGAAVGALLVTACTPPAWFRLGVERVGEMEYRPFGRTGLKVSMLGLGGYHFLEIGQQEVTEIVGRYLDAGGNYVETAYAYGNGDSERKVGAALGARRQEVILATKVAARDARGAARIIDQSLRNLGTDYVDVLFMHAVQRFSELEQIQGAEGALRAAEQARQAGKVRWIGISGHGWPDVLIAALEAYPFDAVMHTFNYLDRFNFPESESRLLPLALEKGLAVVGMKPVGDGYLHRSPQAAFRYAFTLPVSTMVSGMNSLDYLETDLAAARRFWPMSDQEKQILYRDAPELGRWVCRQCYQCMPNSRAVPIPQIFQLEGMYDRQMEDFGITGHNAEPLGARLAFWFGLQDEAKARYRELAPNPDDFAAMTEVEARCPYGLPIAQKLRIAHAKLTV